MFSISLKEDSEYQKSFNGRKGSTSTKKDALFLNNRSEIVCDQPSIVALKTFPTLSRKTPLKYTNNAKDINSKSDGYTAKWCCFLSLIGVFILCKL